MTSLFFKHQSIMHTSVFQAKLIFAILLLAFSTKSNCQKEFAPIGSTWILNNQSEGYVINPLESFFTIESTKDTLIQNLSFRKVGEWLFHQNNDKVYFLWEGELRMIYDFGLELFENVTFEMLQCNQEISSNAFTVVKIDSIEFGNEYLKRIECKPFDIYLVGNTNYTFIEKIGSTRTIVEDLADCFIVPGYDFERLRCFHDNENEYKTDWFLSFGDLSCETLTNTEYYLHNIHNHVIAYPNPTTGQLNFNQNIDNSYRINVISLNGKINKRYEIEDNSIDISDLNEGIYIITLINRYGNSIFSSKIVKI